MLPISLFFIFIQNFCRMIALYTHTHTHINLISIAISANVIFITTKIIDGLQLKHRSFFCASLSSRLDLSARITEHSHMNTRTNTVLVLLFFFYWCYFGFCFVLFWNCVTHCRFFPVEFIKFLPSLSRTHTYKSTKKETTTTEKHM